MTTGENQHIEKKTLDDYYGYIRAGSDQKNPFDFVKNKDKNVSILRYHVINLRSQQSRRSS